MPLPRPDLPESHYPNEDSMLSRKFGREIANYFSGSPLNRVSFLRVDHTFLSTAFTHPSTSFLIFNKLNPLTKNPSELAYASYDEIKTLTGEDPYKKAEEELIKEYNSSTYIPQLVFLGLDSRRSDGLVYREVYKGAPIFALDVTPKNHLKEDAENLILQFEAKGFKFAEGRLNLNLKAGQAAMYAEGRHMLDWNSRNPFCAGCGQPTLSLHGGWKRTCPPTDLAPLPGMVSTTPETPNQRPSCPTRTGITNLSFPRTDPTVIMAVVSSDGKKILLGRQKRWPPHWYSTLAGFLEPAESVEEAVRREVWEESGISLGRVVIHSTQPWPFPANLMIGAIAQAIPGDGERISLGHDAELEDARWFPFEEVREALRIGTSGLSDPPGPDYKEGGLRVPPKTAIAYQLMHTVVNTPFLNGGDAKM